MSDEQSPVMCMDCGEVYAYVPRDDTKAAKVQHDRLHNPCPLVIRFTLGRLCILWTKRR